MPEHFAHAWIFYQKECYSWLRHVHVRRYKIDTVNMSCEKGGDFTPWTELEKRDSLDKFVVKKKTKKEIETKINKIPV